VEMGRAEEILFRPRIGLLTKGRRNSLAVASRGRRVSAGGIDTVGAHGYALVIRL
jgi:hypothetical protein